MIALIRMLRHGPLKRWSPIFVYLGHFYKTILNILPVKTSTSMMIGVHGPFKLDGRFAFSNFEYFGGGKNSALDPCVSAASGQTCVLDIGAHIGLFSLSLSKVLAPNGQIFAFEPSNFNRALLKRHLVLNDIQNVEVSGNLVGGRDVDAVDFFQETGDSPLNSVANRFEAGEFSIVSKRQVSLDSFCKSKGLQPSIIKIDVEGLELEVLKGAKDVLAAYRPKIFLSVHKHELEMLGASIEQLTEYVSEIRYGFYDMNGSPAGKIGTYEYLCLPNGN